MVILALIPHHAAYTLPYMQPLYAFYLPATFYGLNLLIIAVLLLSWFDLAKLYFIYLSLSKFSSFPILVLLRQLHL